MSDRLAMHITLATQKRLTADCVQTLLSNGDRIRLAVSKGSFVRQRVPDRVARSSLTLVLSFALS
jgi:hypothetical protein